MMIHGDLFFKRFIGPTSPFTKRSWDRFRGRMIRNLPLCLRSDFSAAPPEAVRWLRKPDTPARSDRIEDQWSRLVASSRLHTEKRSLYLPLRASSSASDILARGVL